MYPPVQQVDFIPTRESYVYCVIECHTIPFYALDSPCVCELSILN